MSSLSTVQSFKYASGWRVAVNSFFLPITRFSYGSDQMCHAGAVFLNLGKGIWRSAQESPELAKHTNMHHPYTHKPTTIACCVVNHWPLSGLLRYGKHHMGFIQSIYFTSLWSQCCHQVCSLNALSVKCSCYPMYSTRNMNVTSVWIESYVYYIAFLQV